MPKFSVIINRTHTVESSVEIEVSAKDAEAAEEKAQAKISKAIKDGDLDADFEWTDDGFSDDEFEYEVTSNE